MLANDGAGDHLGPHLLLARSGRQHSLTPSHAHLFTPICHYTLYLHKHQRRQELACLFEGEQCYSDDSLTSISVKETSN